MEWREAYPDATAAIHTLIVIIVSQTLKLATSIVNNIILGNTDAPVALVYTIITKNSNCTGTGGVLCNGNAASPPQIVLIAY